MRLSLLMLPVFTILLAGCKKEDDVTPPVVTPPPPAFTLTLNGNQGVEMVIDGNMITIGESAEIVAFFEEDGVINPAPEVSTRFYGAGLYNATAEANAFLMRIGTLEFEAPVVFPDAFWTFFVAGTRAYGSASGGLDALELDWTDGDGVVWSTRCASGVQSGSVFTITEVATDADKLGTIARIKASFNCKLYNCITGATKTVSSGVLVLQFRDF